MSRSNKDIWKIIKSVRENNKDTFRSAEIQLGSECITNILFLAVECADALNDAEDKPVEVFKIDHEKELQTVFNQLGEIAERLGAKLGEDICADALTEGNDTIAKACIRKIDKLIPNGEVLGEMIYEIDNTNRKDEQQITIHRSQAHHIGLRLYTKLKGV